MKKTKNIYPFLVLAAALLFASGGFLLKLVPWHPMAVSAGRSMVAAVEIFCYMAIRKHKLVINKAVLLGGAAMGLSSTFYVLANRFTTAANAIMLQFTAPIFVLLLSMLFWKKQPRWLDIGTCALVFCGVICFFVDGLSMGGMTGNILALLSGLTYAGVFLLNDFPDSDPISSVLWGDLISAVTGLPFLLQETVFTPTAIISLIILGAFQVGLAYTLMCIGLKTTPAVTTSLISGIEPILNPILVAVFYHEPMGPMALLGAVIVIGSVVCYNVIRAKQT